MFVDFGCKKLLKRSSKVTQGYRTSRGLTGDMRPL